ncbi:MAG: hypothetical protein Q9173_003899 [Seirophora scorigena]
MDSSCPLQELLYIVNHVVLPPRLPQQEEMPDVIANAERILLALVLSNAQRFGERCTPECKASWTTVQSMLARWIATKPHSQFSEPLLEVVISEMKPGGEFGDSSLQDQRTHPPSDALPIRIQAQNAALILRHIDEAISVECFELSCSSAAVLGCNGSLRRNFPAHGLAVPIGVAADPSFRHELCNMLSRLALETVDEMMPQARKAGSERVEPRDTCHPGLVTEMLMASLSALGKPHQVQQVQKRIRDDVLWKDCIVPWRRSSLWLLCKISIQTTLLQSTDQQSARAQYKNFIIYFLADILSLASRDSLGIDECKVIQMKTARRAAKLDGIVLPFVQGAAIAAAKAVARSQDEHWQQLQQQDADRATAVSLSSVEEDTALTLHNCRSALDQALRETEGEPQPDIPLPASSHNWITIASDGFPVLHSDLMSTEEETYALAEFEEWISESLPTWLENATDQPCATQCISIANSAEKYKTLALNVYDGCPEQLSLMLLVAGELWRALDTLAGSLTPLLHQYPPEIPSSIFAPLLLPKTAQMQRLHCLELYIQGRYNTAEFTNCSVFADPSTSPDNCFACRYYNQSAGHRELHGRIVVNAEKNGEEKRQEWRQMTDRYNELKRQYDALSQCDKSTNEYGIEKHITSACRKCHLKRSMDQMVIYVFEWPLPRNDILCKLVIFELRCPTFFAAWRNLTWTIIHDLGRSRATVASSPHDFLHSYVQLKSHYEHSSSRVVLGASVKSMNASHYRQMKFPVKLEKICTEHALRWQYYDETRRFWVCDQVDPPSFAGRCETRLPEGSYNNLEFAVNSTDHSQNAVLALQTECSSELNLHEYIAYGSLRADGDRTQWLNLCRELQASNLSWNTEAVCALIKQSAWQAGPSGDTHQRIAHGVFNHPEFCTKFLSNMSTVVDRIQANCQSVYTMNILVVLILRTMSLAGDEWVSKAIALLRKCRTGVFQWMLGLADALRLTTNSKRIQRIRRNLLRVALLCKMTFDVDSEYVSEVMTSPEELAYWAFSSMIVNENTPGGESGLPADLRRFLLCDRKLSHARHKRLLTLFATTTNRGLDQAVLKTWSSFQSLNDLWKYHGDAEDRWLCKVTRPELHGLSQTVYYNILNGQLLVDGRPLGILPKEYTTHDLFIRLFGAQILRVSVSNMAAMLYMTANEEYGYTFYFVLKGSDLVIKAKNRSAVFELVPHQRFSGDFPAIFVEDHVHWLDLYSNEVEFRPLDQRWKPNAENWRLHYASRGISRLEKGQAQLVDVRSSTFKGTLAVFGGIERAEYLHVVQSPDKTIEVALPRLGLRFLANNTGELECQELRKVVDSDQSLGTMIGLRSRLILCAKCDRSSKLDRIVLIPQGDVDVARHNSHVRISIATTGRDVRCLRYQHNFGLDRLDGDGSMLSRLYQAYLHALTSFALPDPLTENLGTEEALRILREQSMRCCKPLEAEEMRLLQPIAALTPKRDFYPKHLRVMQQISWRDDLSPLSQHGEFVGLVDGILARAQMFSIFYSGLGPSPVRKRRGDATLLWRARVRDAAYWNFENGGNLCSADNDKEYQARDGVRDGIRAGRVSAISSLVGSWSKDLGVPAYKLADRLRAWGTVAGFGTTFNLSTSISDLLDLSFSCAWAPLYKYCRCASREKSMYKIFFLFATIAYSSGLTGIKDLKVLLAFATESSLRNLPPFPSYQCFTLERGSTLDRDQVRSSIAMHSKDWSVSKRRRGMNNEVLQKQRTEHERVTNLHVDTMTDICANQWPCDKPAPIPERYSQWIIVKEASSAVKDLFSDWYKNQMCERHLARVQDVLGTLTVSAINSTYEPSTWHQCVCVPGDSHTHPLQSLGSLMGARSPVTPQLPSLLSGDPREELPETNQDLRSLIVNLDTRPNDCKDKVRAQYRDDLLASLADFDTHLETILPGEIPHPLKKRALLHLETYQKQLILEIELVRGELEPQRPIPKLLKMSGLWPRLRVCDLLSATSTTSRIAVPPEWKESIITIGMGLTILQRARRLVLAVERGDSLSFFRELENSGRQGWSAYERPDWLLIEIENDLLVRPVQARVALEMIEPSSSVNTLMQLNMGEGKSSVIIPLIAAALANGDQILRVIVLRSLARQMQDSIMQRLGGLAGRPIYHMPFSRRTKMDESTIRHMQALYEECRKTKGILIAQPEHILSFKLMGLERLASTSVSSEDGEVDSGSYTLATKLLETQTRLEEHCRDVLDESDEILDVKFQLIYTLGAQRSMDGQPDRWIMMESVFDLVARQANILQPLYPGKVEISKQASWSFPTIRLLSTEVREAVISRVIEDIGDSRVYGVVMSNLAEDVKKAAVAFIADDNVAEADCKLVQAHCHDDELYLKKLLFLRGLMAGGILLHVLHDKRWSVNYGLHPTRCLCAVPYRAKGVPAATAEFGHPDVTIALTCLSYYYSGLSDLQIRICLEILQKADDPTAEYDSWTHVKFFPEPLRHWNAVNLEDQQQCENVLYPALRYSKKVADFFLTHVVFPKEGKEFDQKLSTSGWDIPARSTSGKVTTGFSGTNDNRFLLPLTIEQRDPPELLHTSGKVLEFVTRPENLGYACARDDKGAHLSSEQLLQFVQTSDSSIRVLIDVGAQILDLSNDQVIGQWLPLVPDVDAGIYFDENDYAMVLTRMGKREKLATSSFSNRMDRCIVYLDDVHTRGTDLKLPLKARAAVTLGPRLTKDRLVQACMRLRQLGHGQSLMFFAPPEVHQEIANAASTADLNGLDVIRWALEQSCLQIERNQPLRVTQGLHYFQRLEIIDEINDCLRTTAQTDDSSLPTEVISQVVEYEAQSLHDLYAPEPLRKKNESGLITSSRAKPDTAIQELLEIWDRIDLKHSIGAKINEEHEREVAHEVEQETQIERPPPSTPLPREVDPRIREFIRSGLPSSVTVFQSVNSTALKSSSAGPHRRGREKIWDCLRVSTDFRRTVKLDGSKNDDFLRPVHWLLVSQDPEVQSILLISQYEVNQLLDEILDPSSRVALVCYEPRVTKTMPSLDSATAHPLPHAKEAWGNLSRDTRQALHLFAGQLYFTTFEDYERFHRTLAKPNAAPLTLIREWMGIRRKGQNYPQTHIGQVVSGRVLHREMFEMDDIDAMAVWY